MNWNQYIKSPINTATGEACRAAYQAAFDDQKNTISSLVHELNPQNITCLGAGYLNDIPVSSMFTVERNTWLVDWVDSLSVEGLKNKIISKTGNDYACLFCHQHMAERYCSSYSGALSHQDQTCQSFKPTENPVATCGSYVPGSLPNFVTHDATNGVASYFAKRAAKLVADSRKPKDAFTKAIALCRKAGQASMPLPLETGSMDFVTSSMLVSQFDNEPYVYFSRLLEDRFGREELVKNQKKLVPFMEELRTMLFNYQVRGHIKELFRITRPSGKVYFSVELFRSSLAEPEYFLVQGMPQVLENLRKYFYFDLDQITPDKVLRSIELDKGKSVIQCYLLSPKNVPSEY